MNMSWQHSPATQRAILFVAAGSFAFMSSSCSKKPEIARLSASDSVAYVMDNMTHRAEIDSFFRYDGGSPFRRDSTITFHGINWYPIDPHFRVAAVLQRYEKPETVSVMGTKGEERKQLKYGYFEFSLPDDHGVPSSLKINIYKFTPYDGDRYLLFKNILSVWFRDRTTGTETYDVGRYVDVGEEHQDPQSSYVIDFNNAYNPYCAYSSMYSCAVPRKEDFLDIYLRVGERKYHD